MKIQFLGAAKTVTGSCFFLETAETKILVDCGMFQGNNSHTTNKNPFSFNPSEIEYLLLTHAHMDHSGMIPKLVKEGFRGDIISTPATLDLVKPMLLDSAHIQESDAAWLTRKALRSGGEPVEPLYTTADVEEALKFFKGVPYRQIEHKGKGITFRFVDAGHILGSSSLELWFQDSPQKKKILFSGDIGKKGNPIMHDPAITSDANYIVIESTYGNRLHRNFDDTVNELAEAIKTTFTRGGNVIIPAFAVGRTQDLLYVLNQLVREKRLYKINVYIDSPLAEEITKKYLSHPELYDEEAKSLLNQGLSDGIKITFTHSVEESMALNKIKSRAIIIAGSGMCEGGRVQHHLKHNLWRSESSVIFTGFQAKGTLGRKIVDGSRVVPVLGENIAVRARIYTLGGFSAHADQKELLEWLEEFKDHPEIFVVHGEEETALKFAELIKERFGFKTHVPDKGEIFEL
ncbi:MAG: MBL fold metallo-hydrolase [Nitrospiraceae bacterium]|nr:MBL fold metallo-hydrolase [Nitrospiraceae bacterium]